MLYPAWVIFNLPMQYGKCGGMVDTRGCDPLS